MNNLILWFGYNIFPIICVIGAIYLASNNKDGWGWLIFLAFICSVHPVSRSSKSKTEESED